MKFLQDLLCIMGFHHSNGGKCCYACGRVLRKYVGRLAQHDETGRVQYFDPNQPLPRRWYWID